MPKNTVCAVLINPAIDPHIGLRTRLGPQRRYHGGGESYELTEEHLRQWKSLLVAEVHPERYLLLVETGDEVLYRMAVKKYLGAKQIVVQGGDHTLASFPAHIPLILEFAGMDVTSTLSIPISRL
ncbi:MAG TPA: YqiA/YcfP family alpha/beta fold hydrolase [Burkholderiales bacterium]